MKNWSDFNFFSATTREQKPKVAISACLTGLPVRYDGAEKNLTTASTILTRYLTLLPICPEVDAGMSVPRPPLQLQQSDLGLQVIGRGDASINQTGALLSVARKHVAESPKLLSGYIFKSRSPSCGLHSTPVFNAQGQQLTMGSGIQANHYQQHMPWLAMTDEHQLQTAQQCHEFIWRCLLSYDLQQATEQSSLQAVDRHYQFLIRQISAPLQQQLQAHLEQNQQQAYWALLINYCPGPDNSIR